MANAHLPNDHKDVTPDWKPFPFPRPPLSDVFKLRRVTGEGQDVGEYTGFVPAYYCGSFSSNLAAHGGVSASLSIKAAQLYHQELNGSSAATKPLTLHIEYLKPLPQGDFRAQVKNLPIGGRQSCFQVSLRPAKASSPDDPAYSSALVRLGDLSAGGHPATAAIQQPLAPIPDRAKDCSRWSPYMVYAANPVAASMRVYIPRHTKGHLWWSDKFEGQNVRYTWFKPDDGGRFSTEHVPVLLDLVGPVPLNYEKSPDRAIMEHVIPTMSMHITFRGDVTGEEWLVCRAHMKRLQHNWFDMDMVILNEKEEIVATGLQTCAYIPFKKAQRSRQSKHTSSNL